MTSLYLEDFSNLSDCGESFFFNVKGFLIPWKLILLKKEKILYAMYSYVKINFTQVYMNIHTQIHLLTKVLVPAVIQ